MKLKDVADTLERFAPLPLQESYDNAGLQIGLTEADISRVLLCLDITEKVIEEAISLGCQLIISHHPLLFGGLKKISDQTYIERCVYLAIKNDIAIYSAHTNLDNAYEGVNWKIANKIGLQNIHFLQENIQKTGGSGIIGSLPSARSFSDFALSLKDTFNITCLLTNKDDDHLVQSIAICGGSGAFLLNEAIQQKADVFLTGEMGYHHYFGHEQDIYIGIMGHYQSEQFTIELLKDILSKKCPQLEFISTTINTNPIKYL